jgi:23S rRNA (adenine-N6)-dimethyltransferase
VAVRRARGASAAAARSRSQHFLRSSRLAAELVREAEIARHETVFEIGAGDGRLTQELARAAESVLAVELDPRLAAGLRDRFAGTEVAIVEGNALLEPLPTEPYRVFANLPFHVTNATLRRLLDDPRAPLKRADLLVEWGAAQKRTAVWPSTLLGVYWGAWWTFSIERRVAAACFAPRPRVDAGLLVVRRRTHDLVPAAAAERYRRFVRSGFELPRLRDGLTAYVSPRELKRLADIYGFGRDAAAYDLDAHQWAGVFRAVATPSNGAPERGSRHGSSRGR